MYVTMPPYTKSNKKKLISYNIIPMLAMESLKFISNIILLLQCIIISLEIKKKKKECVLNHDINERRRRQH